MGTVLSEEASLCSGWQLVRLAGIEPTTLGFGGQFSPVVFFRFV